MAKKSKLLKNLLTTVSTLAVITTAVNRFFNNFDIFAILGLRALFFCLEDIVERFKYIKYSLAVILILIGIKIFVAHFVPIPKLIPLLITIVLILTGIGVSVIKAK